VAAGPPVAVGLPLAPSSLTKATTMLFELEPLVEYAMVLAGVSSLRFLSLESALTYQ
jgi:hypothetical protein